MTISTDLQRQYERWHQSMVRVEGVTEDSLYPWHKTVSKLLPDLNGKKVLEVGCGRGDFALVLANRFPSAAITATDFSSAAIQIANTKSPPSNLRFTVSDAEALPFADSEFDFIISCECLEHVAAPQNMLAGVARCLKPTGDFIITTENYFNGMILAWINSWLRRKPFSSGSGVQPNENFFVFWKVRRLIERAGLQITHMESNHFVWLLAPGCRPDTFFTEDFARPYLKRVFRPFGRHFTYKGIKPAS